MAVCLALAVRHVENHRRCGRGITSNRDSIGISRLSNRIGLQGLGKLLLELAEMVEIALDA